MNKTKPSIMTKSRLSSKQSYFKRFGIYFVKNWQLYLIFLFPALLLTIIFKYLPMLGIIIAFEEYSPVRGYFGSEWIGLYNFKRLFSSTEFGRLLLNTLKLSGYNLIWGFFPPIILALLLYRVQMAGSVKGAAYCLFTLFYIYDCTGGYGKTVLFAGRTNKRPVWQQCRLYGRIRLVSYVIYR